MNKQLRRKLYLMREIATLKMAIMVWIFNEKYVQKKYFNCPTNEVAVIMEHMVKNKVYHIPFEQLKHFHYSQKGIKIIDELQTEGALVPKTPKNVTLDCPYCYEWMFGNKWQDHKKCFEDYVKENGIIYRGNA